MYDNKKTENENEGFDFYLNHESIKFGYGLGNGVHIDDDGFLFGCLKL